MLLTELEKLVNPAIALRKPNDEKILEYQEKLEQGAVFPPIIIGHWPKSEKYGESGIVDGLHRLVAAHNAKRTEFPTETKKFESLQDMLAYMYDANMRHGLPVTEKQRNSRILLIRKIDPKMSIDKIGKLFGLGKSSIDRILKGEQGEGKSGPKGPTHKNTPKEPMKAAAIFKACETVYTELQRKRPNQLAELGAYLTPITKESPEGELDTDRLAVLQGLVHFFEGLIEEVS